MSFYWLLLLYLSIKNEKYNEAIKILHKNWYVRCRTVKNGLSRRDHPSNPIKYKTRTLKLDPNLYKGFFWPDTKKLIIHWISPYESWIAGLHSYNSKNYPKIYDHFTEKQQGERSPFTKFYLFYYLPSLHFKYYKLILFNYFTFYFTTF